MALKKPKVDTTAKKTPKAKPATGFVPLKFKEHTITQKRSGRFEVLNAKGKNINGADKVKLLIEAKVFKGSFKKAAKEESAAT